MSYHITNAAAHYLKSMSKNNANPMMGPALPGTAPPRKASFSDALMISQQPEAEESHHSAAYQDAANSLKDAGYSGNRWMTSASKMAYASQTFKGNLIPRTL